MISHPNHDELSARITAFITHHHVMTLASTSPSGPWIAPVFYAEQADEQGRPQLAFVSSPASRHATELTADGRAAAAIHVDTTEWQQIRGLQLSGRVHLLEGAERERARQRYAEKFPLIGAPARAPEAIVRAFARIHWFAFVPERAFFTDNAVSFGRREELVWPPTA